MEFVTSDVCSGGAFFHTDQSMPVGTEVTVDLVISTDQLKRLDADRVLIKTAGAVVRTDEEGMAICFEKKYVITPLKSSHETQ